MVDVPYFATNKEWFEYDLKKQRLILTDKAPPEAVDSYKKYKEELKLISGAE